jgi:hypothetical protein
MKARKRKFADGGETDAMSPDDVAEMKARARNAEAYDKAMPEADTTYGKLRSGNRASSGRNIPPELLAAIQKNRPNLSSKYSSVRPAGFEEALSQGKSEAIKSGLGGIKDVAKASVYGPLGAALPSNADDLKQGMGKISDAANRYRALSEAEDAADRELSSQVRREARGMKKGGEAKGYAKGGSVGSASKRADGIAQRGKTRGTIVACGGGYMKGKK